MFEIFDTRIQINFWSAESYRVSSAAILKNVWWTKHYLKLEIVKNSSIKIYQT